MRVNRRMQAYLDELRDRGVGAEPLVPGKWPDLEILDCGGPFLLRSFVTRPHLSVAGFAEATQLECCANKLAMEALVHPALALTCPLLLLTAGLMMAQELSRRLAALPGRFNVIVSYDVESCTVRFHKIRAGQRWLSDDLEGYPEEGVLVFEAGAFAPPFPELVAKAG